MDSLKRKKISSKQSEILISYMESNEMMSNFTNFDKRKAWNQLAKRLNAVGSATKTVEQWKKCWTDMKGYSRNKASRMIMSQLKTSGEPSEVERLSAHEERILNVTGWVATVKDNNIDESRITNQCTLEPIQSTSQSSSEEISETQRSEQIDTSSIQQTEGVKRKRTFSPKKIMQEVQQQNKLLQDLLAMSERIAMACEISVMNNVPMLQELKKQTKILERIEEKMNKNSLE